MDLQLNILCEGEDNIGTVSRVEDVKLIRLFQLSQNLLSRVL